MRWIAAIVFIAIVAFLALQLLLWRAQRIEKEEAKWRRQRRFLKNEWWTDDWNQGQNPQGLAQPWDEEGREGSSLG